MGCKRLVIPLLALVLPLTLAAAAGNSSPPAAERVTAHFFWGEKCSLCAREKPFLEGLQRKYPRLDVRFYEVMHHREDVDRMLRLAKAFGVEASGVPVLFIGDAVFAGFSAETGRAIEEKVKECLARGCGDPMARLAAPPAERKETAVTIPFLGTVEPAAVSLPVFTVILGALDSFNPCAFFVLLFLLSLLIHARSRRKMLLIGGVFVFFSGLVYFLFMAAWLNLFLLVGQIPAITVAAGIVALLIALLNVKDFFFFKEGVSLVIPEKGKRRLFHRMGELERATTLASMLTGTVILAVAANSYELLCTAGFPMVFTRLLTLRGLSPLQHYLYLLLYNVVYVIPLAAIVLLFTATLGAHKLTERQGRVLKLVSGLMMLGLGLILLINPALLNNALVSLFLLGGVLLAAAMIVRITTRIRADRSSS